MTAITNQKIADYLGKPLQGENLVVQQPGDLESSQSGEVVWVRNYAEERVRVLNQRRPALAICDSVTASHMTSPCIISERPRWDFIRVLNRFFTPQDPVEIHPTAIINPKAIVGNRVSIGSYARVGAEVVIGDDCIIGSGVSLEGPVVLGRGCRIKANSVIGEQGFGFERDEDGTPMHFPHLGKVVLEEGVWIGACTTIERATLGVTRLCANVKVDDLVQIGHNTLTGPNTLIMANVVLCGGAVIGSNCWIAPNSVIKQKVRVGDNVTVGLGAVVIRDVEDGLVVAGVPAKPLPQGPKPA